MKKRRKLVWSTLLLFLCLTGAAFSARANEDGCSYYAAYGDHDWVLIDSNEPTCEEGGGYQLECRVCQSGWYTLLEATGHEWNWSVVEEATCTEEGLGVAVCPKCGRQDYEPIQPVDHSWGSPQILVQATCTAQGSMQEICSNCNAAREYPYGPTAHVYGDWSVIVEATENTRGTRARTCSNCGEGDTEGFYPEGTIYRWGANDTALVMEVQQKLLDLGFLNDSVDGIFGPNTEAAVMAFQKAHGYTADGIGWPQTVKAVRSLSAGEISGSDALKQLKQRAKEQGAICAVAYLGYYEQDAAQLQDYLSAYALDQRYPFLTNISDDQFIAYEGNQLYCLIPVGENTSVTVKEWIIGMENNYSGAEGENLYEGKNGLPVLVRCNISDIVPNLQIQVADVSGENLLFYPFMSLKDNTLQTPEGGEVLDFTPYDAEFLSGYNSDLPVMGETDMVTGLNPGEIWGEWAANGVYSQNGNLYDCGISFYGDNTLAYAFGKSEEAYESYYTGSWWYLEEEDGYQGVVKIQLQKTEGTAQDIIEGEYLLVSYGEETIAIVFLEGDYLLPLQDRSWFTLDKTYG